MAETEALLEPLTEEEQAMAEEYLRELERDLERSRQRAVRQSSTPPEDPHLTK
jgi:hypothetical protein